MAAQNFEKLSKTEKILEIYDTQKKQKINTIHYKAPCEIVLQLVKKEKRYAHLKFKDNFENEAILSTFCQARF